MMLDRSKLLPKLARKIYKATKKFKDRIAEGEGGGEDAAVESKFFEDGDGRSMEYGTTDVFFGGLDGFLGPPNPNLDVTVLNEHNREHDSKHPFVVPNYKTSTTSELEYWFVADPSDEKLAEVGAEKWPIEARDDLMKVQVKGKKGDPDEYEDHRRKIIPLKDFIELAADKNEHLRELHMDPLQDVEIVCARLYTGPVRPPRRPRRHARRHARRRPRRCPRRRLNDPSPPCLLMLSRCTASTTRCSATSATCTASRRRACAARSLRNRSRIISQSISSKRRRRRRASLRPSARGVASPATRRATSTRRRCT